MIRKNRQNRSSFISSVLVLILLPTAASTARGDEETPAKGYRTPPGALMELVDAAEFPDADISPDFQFILLKEPSGRLGIEDLAQPELRLAGLRINPKTMGPARPRSLKRLTVLRVKDGRQSEVALPSKGAILDPRWSPDSGRIAFILIARDGLSLCVAEVDSGASRVLIEGRVNGSMGRNLYHWLSDGGGLVCRVRSETLSPPEAPAVPVGPNIQVSSGVKAPVRTYQDLLKSVHDERLFEYYTRAQLTHISLDGKQTPIGPPAMFLEAQPSPDSRYLLVRTLEKPFSYLVPFRRFPQTVQVWDRSGKVVKSLAELPLAENLPRGFDAVRTGPRSVAWRADADATLAWAEAQDQGNPRLEAKVRDRVFILAAPFKEQPRELAALDLRFRGIEWGHGELALVTGRWRRDRGIRTWKLSPDRPDTPMVLLVNRSYEDRYNDPGNPLTHSNARGFPVLLTVDKGQGLLYEGEGASPKGDRPFLSVRSWEKGPFEKMAGDELAWQSEDPWYERIVGALDGDGYRFLTRRESIRTPPNYYIRDMRGGPPRALTRFPHPTPALADVRKELISYPREDGVNLTANLYLPPGYREEDGPLPMLVWAYPREFKSADAAGQVKDSPFRFARISYWGPLPYLSQGYGVLHGPSLPIIGEGDREPNDTYVSQLVAGARAAVDEVVRRGVADRNRMAIGGHSYGAFMAANLLAHSDLFRAGIARSGAYNRSLTPFGFQAEERGFWEAQEVYANMSPFFNASKIQEPLLLIHGEADNNSGTYPLQSKRMFQALKGLGVPARLVMLPHESHRYVARESLLHMLWEQWSWLETHVKPIGAPGAQPKVKSEARPR